MCRRMGGKPIRTIGDYTYIDIANNWSHYYPPIVCLCAACYDFTIGVGGLRSNRPGCIGGQNDRTCPRLAHHYSRRHGRRCIQLASCARRFQLRTARRRIRTRYGSGTRPALAMRRPGWTLPPRARNVSVLPDGRAYSEYVLRSWRQGPGEAFSNVSVCTPTKGRAARRN